MRGARAASTARMGSRAVPRLRRAPRPLLGAALVQLPPLPARLALREEHQRRAPAPAARRPRRRRAAIGAGLLETLTLIAVVDGDPRRVLHATAPGRPVDRAARAALRPSHRSAPGGLADDLDATRVARGERRPLQGTSARDRPVHRPLRRVPRAARPTPAPPRGATMSDARRARVVEALAEQVVGDARERGPGHCLQVAARSRRSSPTARAQIVDEQLDSAGRARSSSRPIRVETVARDAREGRRAPKRAPRRRGTARRLRPGRATRRGGGQLRPLDLRGPRRRRSLPTRSSTTSSANSSVDSGRRRVEPNGSSTSVADDAKFGVGRSRDVAAYLARLHRATPTETEVGRALVELGLLPDSGVAPTSSTGSRRSARTEPAACRGADRARRRRPIGSRRSASIRTTRARSATTALCSTPSRTARSTGASSRTRLDGDAATRSTSRRSSATSSGAPSSTSSRSSQLERRLRARAPSRRRSTRRTRRSASATVAGPRRHRRPVSRNCGSSSCSVGEHGGELVETGVEAAKSGRRCPANAEASWKIRVPTQNLDAGLVPATASARVDDGQLPVQGVAQRDLPDPRGRRGDRRACSPGRRASRAALGSAARADGALGAAAPLPRLAVGQERRPRTPTHLASRIRFEGSPGAGDSRRRRCSPRCSRTRSGDPVARPLPRLARRRNELEETILPDEGVTIPDASSTRASASFAEIARNQYAVEGRDDRTARRARRPRRARASRDRRVRRGVGGGSRRGRHPRPPCAPCSPSTRSSSATGHSPTAS